MGRRPMIGRAALVLTWLAIAVAPSRATTQCSTASPFRFVALEILHYTGPEGITASRSDGSGPMPFDSIVSAPGAKVGWLRLDTALTLSQIDLVPRQPDWAFDRQSTQRASGRVGACIISLVFESAQAWSVQLRTLPRIMVAPLDDADRPGLPVLAPVVRGPLRETEVASWRLNPDSKLHIDVQVSKASLDKDAIIPVSHEKLIRLLVNQITRRNKMSIGLVPDAAAPDTLWFQRVRK
jgi:hypothetical protein